MTTVVWPAGYVPVQVDFGLRSNTMLSSSDLSGDVQTMELPGARWTMSVTMRPMHRDTEGGGAENSAVMEAFVASLRGQAVRARIPVFARAAPRGAWGGSPNVNNDAASPPLVQTGNTLEVKGFAAGTTVKAGDYFNLGTNGQLLMVAVDGVADGGGLLTLSVQPAIRSAPSNGLPLVSANPVVPLMILTDPHPRWRMKGAVITEHALDFVEVFG